MINSGYLSIDQEELNFFDGVASSRRAGLEGVLDIVGAGHPVMATVTAGFAENKAPHAIILETFDEDTDTVTIFDPDNRNDRTTYSSREVQDGLALDGACTVVLSRL